MSSRSESQLLDDVGRWVERNRDRLVARGLRVELTHGLEHHDKLASWVDIDSATRLVRLIVWDSGEANLAVGDVPSGLMLADEHLEISGALGIEHALQDASAWALGNQPA